VAENIFSVAEKTVGKAPNVIYFLQKEPWKPVFVFAVSGLGTPASRRLAHWYTDDSGIKIVVAAWLLANADY
jgi:hypothetical protein